MNEQITRFTRESVKLISDEIDKALDVIREAYGLKELYLESVNFMLDSMTVKLKGRTYPEKDTLVTDYREAETKFFLERFELPDDFLQMQFIMGGKHYMVERIETRNPKYPVIAQCLDDGKNYKFSVEQMKRVIQNTGNSDVK